MFLTDETYVCMVGGVSGVVDDLEERLRAVCGQVNAAHALLVDVVAEVIATGAWEGWGIRSLNQWLTWQAGVSTATAARVVAVAEAKVSHPLTAGVFGEGGLSLDQAALAVSAPAYLDGQFADLAVVSTVAQLRIELRAARPTPDPDRGEAAVESVSSWFDDDGRYHLAGDLDADRGRLVDAALTEARGRLFSDGHSAVTGADALVDIAERSLDATTPQRRERFRVNVFLDPRADIAATWGDGSSVPDAIRRHLDCDAMLTPTFVAAGRPVSVGPGVRVVPDRTRRLVLHRDRKCRVPWCPHTRRLQIHHVVHWEDGGATDTANLIAVCAGDHRDHHHGQLGISGDADDPDGLTFTDANGRVLDPAARPTTATGPPPRPKAPYQHPLGERLDTRALHFADPPDTPPPQAA